jgi:hypothetical protein
MECIRAGIFAVPGAAAFDKPQPTGMRLRVEPLERVERHNGDPAVAERVNSCSQQLAG